MWGRNFWRPNTAGLPWVESNRLPHRNQVASELVRDVNSLAGQWECCNNINDGSEEENEECKCDPTSIHHEKISFVAQDMDADESNCSTVNSILNMIGMLIGLGQLSTPYALANGGWASSFLLVGLGIMCAYTCHLLGKCLDNNPKSSNYADVGHQAFGLKGRLIACAFVYMEIFMTLVSYTISLHDNLATVFPAATHLLLHLPGVPLSTSQLLSVLAILVALPSLWLRNLSSISFLSTCGILMSVVICLSVAATPIVGGVKANHVIPVLQLHKISSISGLYMFSYAGHIVFPNLYKSMKDPSSFTKVSIISFTVVTGLYTALAFLGAKLFGPGVDSQITLSMPRHLMITKVAMWATVLTPMTKYALEFAPFAMQLEEGLPASMGLRGRRLVRGGVGSLLLLLMLALALSVPYFEHVLNLTGSLVSVFVCAILPCVFYTKIYWKQISRPRLAFNTTLIVLAFVLGVGGTISSSKTLIRTLQAARS